MGDPENITVSRQVLLVAMYETPELVSTKATDLTEVISHVNVAKNRAYMTVKDIIDVYSRRLFYITVDKIGRVDVHLSKH